MQSKRSFQQRCQDHINIQKIGGFLHGKTYLDIHLKISFPLAEKSTDPHSGFSPCHLLGGRTRHVHHRHTGWAIILRSPSDQDVIHSQGKWNISKPILGPKHQNVERIITTEQKNFSSSCINPGRD